MADSPGIYAPNAASLSGNAISADSLLRQPLRRMSAPIARKSVTSGTLPVTSPSAEVPEISIRDYERIFKSKMSQEDIIIQSIPTMLIFKNGNQVDKLIGALPRQEIERHLKAVL